MSELSIEGLDLLRGRELRFEEGMTVTVREGRIESIGRGRGAGLSFSGRGLLALPPLVNAHVHLGDAAFKELGLGLSLDELVKPPLGLKHRLLAEARREELAEQMREALRASLSYGIYALADFREGGLEGLSLLKEACEGLPVKVVKLARPKAAPGPGQGLSREQREEAELLLREAEGLGLSGANEYSDEALLELSSLARSRGRLLALHAAEAPHTREASRRLTGEDELVRALRARPSFLVHGVALMPHEAALLRESGVGLVLCPRSNAGFGSGLPPVAELIAEGVRLGLGTDNVMINEPDLFREMEFLSKAYRLFRRSHEPIAPRDILAMATVWGAELLGLPCAGIEEGSPADLLFLAEEAGLRPLKDPHASVVHRAGPHNVRALMLKGRLALGSLKEV